jgi:hypothetical protein
VSSHNDKDTPENIIRRRAALYVSIDRLHEETNRQWRFLESCKQRVIAECPHEFETGEGVGGEQVTFCKFCDTEKRVIERE